MKVGFGLVVLLLSSGFAQASDHTGRSNLCPKFYSVAVATGMSYRHQQPGTAFDDDLETAKIKAVRVCEDTSGSCLIQSCMKNTGPVIPVPWACKTQW